MHNGRGFDRTPGASKRPPLPYKWPVCASAMMLGTMGTRRAYDAFVARANGPVMTAAWPVARQSARPGQNRRSRSPTPRQIAVVGLAWKLKWVGTFPAHFHFQIARR
jgi:hypothetical protein